MGQNGQQTPFKTLHHLSLVVHDLEATVAYLDDLGFGPWFDYPPFSEYVVLEGIHREEFSQLQIRCTQIGPVVLQIIAPPPGESEYRHFLDNHGPGIFHLGFEVDDVDEAETAVKSKGLDVLMRGRRENGSGFAYFDSAGAAGVRLLVRQSPPL